MSFYLECFDKKTGIIVLEYKLKNVTAEDLQNLMNVSEKRRIEDPEFIDGWRNNKISKNKISFFENLLQGRKIDLDKYIVHFSNLDDSSETLEACGGKNENITFHEPPDWLTKKDINRINQQLEEENKREKIFHKKLHRIKKRLLYILDEIKNQDGSVMLVPNYRNQNKIFEINIDYAFRIIYILENYILAYESILLSLKELSYKISGKAAVKLLELCLIFNDLDK
jgi:hypothetical protein